MPYIKNEQRPLYDAQIESLVYTLRNNEPTIDGDLNYVLSRIVAGSLERPGQAWRYQLIARAVAVFECAKLEFYRRIGARREDEVIAQNGDMPEYDR